MAMGQRSGIASGTDMGSVRQSAAKAPSRPARSVARNVAVLALLGSLVYVSPHILGPGFLQNKARGLADLANVAGSWVRAALAAGFQSIPTL